MPLPDDWPELPYEAWRDTRDTLHMYLQIIGKVRLKLAPMEPQWGQVPLYVTARGLTTSPMPHPNGTFDVDVDLIEHVVAVRTALGSVEPISLEPRPVADFYERFMHALERANVPVAITVVPSEVPNPIPFPEDLDHRSYDAEWANRYFRALASIDAALKEHRARYRGRTLPISLFWGSFDLVYDRFSGRPAEPPPNADLITRYAADAEQICAGFWPGDARLEEPTFFSYTYPAPAGIEEAQIEPEAARWDARLGEFVVPYDAIRLDPNPRGALLAFLESTYRAGAELAGWDPALAPLPSGVND